MKLSEKAREEFKEIYYREIGEEISDREARELAESLLSLFKIICRPLPKKEGKQKEEHGFSGSH